MRYLLLLSLAACSPTRVVVKWWSTGAGTNERIEIPSSGNGNYTRTDNGRVEKDERVILTSDQVHELDELFLGQGACQLKHDPEYTPRADEGQTTLELAFPDQTCKVVLYNTEWDRGHAQPIAETMRSMRPLQRTKPTTRKVNPL
ncbi:MAG TPA: hypothetical protein VF516_16680 [Kofleriaceae bacterium]